MKPTARWRQLLDQRLQEAVTVLGRIDGVQGFIVGGSVGRGEPWPMSDIDLLPIYRGSTDPASEVDQRRAELVDWWAASGRAQTLDLGWLAFTAAEIREAMAAGPEQAAARMADRRWFHGLDKAYGGHAADPDDEVGNRFAAWINGVRFHPAVVTARIDAWWQQATGALAEAARIRPGDPVAATYQLRESARALRLVLIERWGERLGSMGREWTRFERLADRHGHAGLAARIAVLAGADTSTAAPRARLAPPWLQERIELCYGARTAIGEEVSPDENARDQLAAFTVHVVRHRPDLHGPWTGSPDPHLDTHLADLRDLITQLG
ncbi:nucleotidyltransferase domain-containing protein [Krasilnikovia sp. M28-CT-15]|uniref:nucleotidyltransferase domain-containing protein n=1 Tax=Krasilnikovia sp. M28-CT-15 TaxID=3373540 RepID=UPI003875D568